MHEEQFFWGKTSFSMLCSGGTPILLLFSGRLLATTTRRWKFSMTFSWLPFPMEFSREISAAAAADSKLAEFIWQISSDDSQKTTMNGRNLDMMTIIIVGNFCNIGEQIKVSTGL